MNIPLRCLVLVSAGLLGACATAPNASQSSSARASDCFFARSLRSWRYLDDRNLVVFAGRQPHHVELVAPMPGLDRNIAIGLFDRDGLICPGDAIVARNLLPDRVTIRSVRRISDDELEALYVQFGLEPAAVVELRPIDVEDEPTEAQAPADEAQGEPEAD